MIRKKIFRLMKKMKEPTLYFLYELGFYDDVMSEKEIESSLSEEEDAEDDDVIDDYSDDKEDQVHPLYDVSLLFEDYIGIVLSEYTPFDSDVIHASDLSGKLLSKVDYSDNYVELTFSTVSGKYYSSVLIYPTQTGQFLEKTEEENPAWSSRFRFSFVGSGFIDYLDSKGNGRVEVRRVN